MVATDILFTFQAHHEGQCRISVNVVIPEGEVILELLASKNQALPLNRHTNFVCYRSLHARDGGRELAADRDCSAFDGGDKHL